MFGESQAELDAAVANLGMKRRRPARVQEMYQASPLGRGRREARFVYFICLTAIWS